MTAGEASVFVIAGGPLGSRDFLRSQLAEYQPVGLVCADGGAGHLEELGVTPAVIIGDMDSLAPEVLKRYEGQGSLIIRRPRDKTETDTQLALEYAMQLPADEIRIYGALGGRIDHTLANISLLALALKRGVAARLVDEWCEVFLVTGAVEIQGRAGQTVSLFPFAGTVQGIYLEGFAYPLAGGAMEIGVPYGISNRLEGDRGTITIGSGILLAVKYHQPDRFPEEY